MANYFSVATSRLIRARCYTKGEKILLERRLTEAEARFREAKAEYTELQKDYRRVVKRMASLEAEIRETTDIDPDEIGSMEAIPKRFTKGFKYGVMVAELVNFFLDTDRPLSTVEIRTFMTTRFGVPTNTPEERQIARLWTRDKIKALVHKGAIIPLHAPDAGGVGLWQWVGIERSRRSK